MGLYCSYYNSLVNSLSHSHDYLFFFHFLNLQLPFHLVFPLRICVQISLFLITRTLVTGSGAHPNDFTIT